MENKRRDFLKTACAPVVLSMFGISVLEACSSGDDETAPPADDNSSTDELNNLLGYTLNLPGEFAVMIVQDLRQRKIEVDYLKNWPLWLKNFNKLLH